MTPAAVVHWLSAAAVVAALAAAASAHGMTSDPRIRGALKCDRDVTPQTMDDNAKQDYCSHCLNAGGTGAVAAAGGAWTPYEPMKGNKRRGFGICGDVAGSDDHMKTGVFANPATMPSVADYTRGGVANFEFDATANHGGYLEFYLCDVGANPNEDIQFSTFADDCHYLERVAKDSCEAGTDDGCGPIDPKYPGRWVLPCRVRAGDQGDQIFGGSNGKMGYRIPDVDIAVGVVHTYWFTTNTCVDQDGFMDNYAYPSAWAGCPGDGGSTGGKPSHPACGDGGGVAEEYWMCSDVTVGGGGGGGGAVPDTPTSTSQVTAAATTSMTAAAGSKATTKATTEPTTAQDVSSSSDSESGAANGGGGGGGGGGSGDGCVADGDYCSSGGDCCSSGAVCERLNGDGKVGEVCSVSGGAGGSGGHSGGGGGGHSGRGDGGYGGYGGYRY
jgi:predicted carbohydrate-binding protein with CBM5 and CBM33 domain